MLSPRWRKVWQDLRHNKLRTALVVLSVAVGIFAVGMIGTTRETIGAAMEQSWQSASPAQIELTVDKADQAAIDLARGVPGVAVAEGRRVFLLRMRNGPAAKWQNLRVQAVAGFPKMQLNQIRSVRGAWPPGPQELLLERSTLANDHLQVGDTIELEMRTGEVLKVAVAGETYDAGAAPPMLTGLVFGYISMDSLPWLGQPGGFNQINLTVTERGADEAHLREVAGRVSDELGRHGVVIRDLYIAKPGQHPAQQLVTPLMMILGALGVVALLLSGFLVINVINALLAQQTRQVGIMKAVGARPRQILGLYLGLVLSFGALALLLGVPLGALGAWAFGSYIGQMLNLDAPFNLPLSVLATQLGVGLLVPLAAAFFPVLRSTRLSARVALSGSGGGGYNGNGPFNRLLRRVALSRPLQMSLRNAFRRKGRLALTLFTLVLGCAVAIGVFSTRDSALLTMANALKYFNYDVRLYSTEQLDQRSAAAEAAKVQGVTRAEVWNVYAGMVEHDGVLTSTRVEVLTPVPDTDMIRPTVKAGRWLQAGDGNNVVVNSDLLRSEPGADVGKDLVLKVNGQTLKLHVVGVVTGQLSGALVFGDPDWFAQAMPPAGRASMLVAQTDRHTAAAQLEIGAAIREQFQRMGILAGNIRSTAEMRETAEAQFNILVVLLLVMAGVLALVGALGLTGTMSINVLERTREIGVMRAIGASNGAVVAVFLVEGLLVGTASWGLGLLASVPLGQWLSNFVGVQFMGTPMDYRFSWQGALLWLAVSLMLAAASSLLPARSAARLSVREVLAYE